MSGETPSRQGCESGQAARLRGAGRSCPADYRYPQGALAAADEGQADVLYTAGGLYGNTEALRALRALVRRESGRVRIVLAGDFHWFDVAEEEFAAIAEAAQPGPAVDRQRGGERCWEAIAGNVERELTRYSGAGCGCAYPDYVSERTVEWSNAIISRLQEQAQYHTAHVGWLATLPLFKAIRVGGERILVLHGDTESLAGWSFAAERLVDAPEALQRMSGRHAQYCTDASWLSAEFERVHARIIACSHTCLPIARPVHTASGDALLINNGAAGMPNFHGRIAGLVTRIAAGRRVPRGSLYGMQLGPVRCDALELSYDPAAWWRRFTEQWPQNSPAYLSYAHRLCEGPDYALEWARALLG